MSFHRANARLVSLALLLAATCAAQAAWKPHDRLRPRPTVVTPADAGAPPSDATVLFDGKTLSGFVHFNPRDPDASGPPRWKIENGAATAAGGQLQTRDAFADCHLHLEWKTSEDEARDPVRIDQKRGNSGVEFGDHPEIQILDSFANDTYPDGQAAALYGLQPPLVNAMRPPGQWQTYDIFYTAPVFASGKKIRPATYTVLHNGLPVQLAREVPGDATSCRVRIRPHGGRLHYRNIWIRPLHDPDENAGKPLPPGARVENPFPKKEFPAPRPSRQPPPSLP
ncbi:MAG: DUF1080 domain-containing protein [Opitutaceae bacterium]|jgi:hypothetical protein|nr:DUF1080 domain-containing protein [Opitutaceae bacterium]